MMRSLVLGFLVAAITALVVLPRAGAEPKRDGTTYRGTIRKLDVAVGTIAVQLAGKNEPEEKMLSLLSKDIKVLTTAGTRAKLADLREGLYVTLHIDPMGEDVDSILVELPTVLASLKSVDRHKKTVTLADSANAADRVLPVSAEAIILVDGKASTFDAISPNELCQLTLALDGKTVIGIAKQKTWPLRDPAGADSKRLNLVFGVVFDTDHDRRRFNVVVGENNPFVKKYYVSKKTPIKLVFDDRAVGELTFEQITKDVAVTLIMRSTAKVTQINAHAPTVRGILKAIDVEKGQVVVQGEGGEQAFSLARQARVFVRGQQGTLREARPGMRVTLALSLDRRQVVGLSTAASERE